MCKSLTGRLRGYADLPRVLAASVVALGMLVAHASPALAQSPEEALAAGKAAKEQVVDHIRHTGLTDRPAIAAAEQVIRSGLANDPAAGTRSELLIVLADLARIDNRCGQELPDLQDAVRIAALAGRRDLVFKADIAIARCGITLKNHDAAAEAVEQAQEAAGDLPDRDQIADLTYFRTFMLEQRGDLEAALPWAARAVRAAVKPEDAFLAHAEAGGVFFELVRRCVADQQITHSKSAMQAARQSDLRAAEVARREGWEFAAEAASALLRNVTFQQIICEQFAQWRSSKLEEARQRGRFEPVTAKNVLPLRDWAITLGSMSESESAAIDELTRKRVGGTNEVFLRAISEHEATYVHQTSASLSVEAWKLEAKGDVVGALALQLRAVDLIERERGTFFDLRNRGTTIADQKSTYERPALFLLRTGREAEAFRVFELARARGLAELSNLGDDESLSQDDFAAAAALLETDARISAATRKFADAALAAEDLPLDHPALDDLARNEERRRQLAANIEPTLTRLATRPKPPLATLDGLQAAAARTNTGILLYWDKGNEVIEWYVGPQGSTPLFVMLWTEPLRAKVDAVRSGIAHRDAVFDQKAARELFLFLISPFSELLKEQAVMIVPQGPLTDLPFEVLIDPSDGRFLAEKFTISYAPNATLALAALNRTPHVPRHLLAAYAPLIDAVTDEIAGIEAALGVDRVHRLETYGLTRPALAAQLAGADALHVLAHGKFEAEPLLSTIDLSSNQQPPTPAAQLLGLPLRGLSLAVLSACESGVVAGTSSNEIFGIPWVLLVGGVDTVVLSRWRVQGSSNATWMKHFYGRLAGGGSPAESATAAMRAMLADPASSHPYYWASMQVIGR